MGRGERKQSTPAYQLGTRTLVAPMIIESYSQSAIPLPEYSGLMLQWDRELSKEQQDRASGILAYWASLPFVSGGSSKTVWLAKNQLWIDCDSSKSSSSDWRAHRPFELLEDWLVKGTPNRKTQQNSQAFSGIGQAPARAILSHPPQRIIESPKTTNRPRPRSAQELLKHQN
jgi:hypothetical protein